MLALEHGLTERERLFFVAEMAGLIPTHGLQREHTVAWVAYATEFGYAYSGESFWPALESQTRGWERQSCRPWIGEAFQRFAREYRGIKPRSNWAATFDIMAEVSRNDPVTNGPATRREAPVRGARSDGHGWVGEVSDMLAGWIEAYDRLIKDPDPRLREIGRLGADRDRRQHAEARVKERRRRIGDRD